MSVEPLYADAAADNCTVRGPDYIVIAVLNVLSDISIMVIPMPLLWRAQIRLQRKLALSLIFGLGVFVMIATILRAYYSLLSLDALPIALGWASRETFCATVAVCTPGIKPLFTKSRWLRAANADSRSNRPTGSNRYLEFSTSSPYGANATHISSDPDGRMRSHNDAASMKGTSVELAKWARKQHGKLGRRNSSGESDERVIMEEDKDIVITTEYGVSKDSEPGLAV